MSKTVFLRNNLVEGCKQNQAKAQMQLYDLYCEAMFKVAQRYIKNNFEAEDIMQESFLAAFEKINTYSGKVSFGSWLKKIVVNRSLDALRKKRIEIVELSEQSTQIEEEKEINEVEIHYEIERIKEAMENLPDGYRVVLSLYLFEGYDHDEIAEIMGIHSSTSRSQFARAKQRLLRNIEQA